MYITKPIPADEQSRWRTNGSTCERQESERRQEARGRQEWKEDKKLVRKYRGV